MNVKLSFDKAAVERRGHTLEDVHRTIKNLFAVYDFPCVSEDNILAFKDKGHGDDFATMWDIILSLLRSEWFMDCATSCVWEDEDGVEDVLSQVRETRGPCSNSPLGAAGSARQISITLLHRLGKAPPTAGPKTSPPRAVRSQA